MVNNKVLDLTEEEREFIIGSLTRGEALPDDYRFRLFKSPLKSELIWPGKTHEVCKAELPFQTIEHIDAPRLNDHPYTPPNTGWTNKLIWGDNKLILSSLRSGSLRRQIDEAGGIKLIYIDPPFDVGADFKMPIEIGDGDSFTKEPSVIEEIAYRDTWGKGVDSYLSMIYERLRLMHELMADDASIYVHCDWRLNSHLRKIMDEIFGENNFRNEVIWHYKRWSNSSNGYQKMHDSLMFYSKYLPIRFNTLYQEYANPEWIEDTVRIVENGKLVRKKNENGEYIKREKPNKGVPMHDVWEDINFIAPTSKERLHYPTQKPEALLYRIIKASSNPGDLVADFFCGSGTTMAVAEKLGRKWLGCDLSRFAIHTSRKRLIQVQCELRANDKLYAPFEILNLGHYDRQYYMGIDRSLSKAEQAKQANLKENDFYNLIHKAYKSDPLHQMLPFHGRKSDAAVYIGPLDAPITISEIEEILAAAKKYGFKRVDVLGFEFEMGLKPFIQDQAKEKGVLLSLRYIPREVFDKRAVEKDQVMFYDVAYVEAKLLIKKKNVAIQLTDFGVFYRQEDIKSVGQSLKPGGSKVIVDQGAVIKVNKDRKGKLERQTLTKHWTDWIDYWAIDFDYESLHDPKMGNCIFENQWQTFRTKKDRKLGVESAPYAYSKSGNYKIAIKVVDIFGHDTTKVIDVEIG